MAPTRIFLVPAGSVLHHVAPATAIMKRTTQPRVPLVAAPSNVDPIDLLAPKPPSKPRRRERLSDLTPEQKMARRKLKNRVAAQTARDRKKERTCGLEEAIRALMEENKQLKARLDKIEKERQRDRERWESERREMESKPQNRIVKVERRDDESSYQWTPAEGTGSQPDRLQPTNDNSYASSLPPDLIPQDELSAILQDLQSDPEFDALFSSLGEEVLDEEADSSAFDDLAPYASEASGASSPCQEKRMESNFVTGEECVDEMDWYGNAEISDYQEPEYDDIGWGKNLPLIGEEDPLFYSPSSEDLNLSLDEFFLKQEVSDSFYKEVRDPLMDHQYGKIIV